MDSNNVRILIFENDKADFIKIARSIQAYSKAKIDIRWSKDGNSIVSLDEELIGELSDVDLLEENIDIIVMDLEMPVPSDKYGAYGGIVLLESIFCQNKHCRSIIVTSKHTNTLESKCPSGWAVLNRLEEQHGLIRIDKNAQRADNFSLIKQIIASRSGRRLLTPNFERQIIFVGRTHDPVLILGAAGCGKEGIANSIHNVWCEYKRSGEKRPFMPVNAGALQYELFRSELFGYDKGAFTGALDAKAGLAFQAVGIKDWKDIAGKEELPVDNEFHGTLFLDEIGNLDARCQGLLLRFLETPFAAAPLGHAEVKNVRPRIIAATNDPKWMELACGGNPDGVRADLFARVARNIIWVPDLDPDDVSGIIRMLAAQKWTPNAMEYTADLVGKQSIRGNIRGLINFIKRAELIVEQGADLGWDFKDVSKEVVALSLKQSLPNFSKSVNSAVSITQDEPRFITPRGNTVEKKQIESVFEYVNLCEMNDPSRTKDVPGSLKVKYGESKAELIFLAWFALYGSRSQADGRNFENFKNEGALKWFSSQSTTMAHRGLQETAKSVLATQNIKEITSKASDFKRHCQRIGLWPREFL